MRPKVKPASEIWLFLLSGFAFLSTAPFPAKCEWPQAASPSVGALRARLSPSLPGCSLSPRPRTHAQQDCDSPLIQHTCRLGLSTAAPSFWAPPALWYSHRQHVWVWLAYGCGVIPDPTAGHGEDRCTERCHWFIFHLKHLDHRQTNVNHLQLKIS